MTPRFFNTLSRKQEELTPLKKGKIGMYVCGITPYDASHLGHARCYITWDVLRRYLEFSGFHVTHVQNFTDIDDKIIKKAHEVGEDPVALAKRFSDLFFEEFDRLGVQRAHHYPTVSGHIPEIVALISKLVKKGVAYESAGDVLFEVGKFKEYGKLSHQHVSDLVKGKRVEPGENKRHPEDFALWKSAKPGEPSWESPWGKGRPGWHIECSAMSAKYLGEQFDVHCGGQDLMFPHHENEIAQSEAASGKKPFVTLWMHNGFVTVKSDKMAKSLGNFMTVAEALSKHSPQAIRFFMLSTHYRQPIDYNEKALTAAQQSYNTLENARMRWAEALEGSVKKPKSVDAQVEELALAFFDALDDDFNIPLGISILYQLRDYGFAALEKYEQEPSQAAHDALANALEALEKAMGVLGFARENRTAQVNEKEIEGLVAQREKARKAKDYKKSDEIRALLKSKGIELEDSKDGVKWRIAR